MQETILKNIPFEEALILKNIVSYSKGEVENKTLIQRDDLSITMFAFDKGEGLSTQAAIGEAMAYVIEGSMNVRIGHNKTIILSNGEMAALPANRSHAMEAMEKSKMMIVVIKS